MRILVTGAAGFIGSAVCRRLQSRDAEIVGIDNLNDYYDVTLKQARLDLMREVPNFEFRKLDVSDRGAMESLFAKFRPDRVVHLAAQAGVRYSLKNPHAYLSANIDGFLNILEGCRHNKVDHLVFASSSSVYGANTKLPFSESDNVDHPVSLYAASKKANELMAHSYSHLYGLPTTGLRFFTVYGPWGRPDMAIFHFTKNILEGRPIDLYNHGEHRRDFTYVDDIIEGVIQVMDRAPAGDPNWNGAHPDPSRSKAPYRLYNIGNNSPVWLSDFVDALEAALGRKAIRNFLPMQPGDVVDTCADVSNLARDFDFTPKTTIEQGVQAFVTWYRDYYGLTVPRASTEQTVADALL